MLPFLQLPTFSGPRAIALGAADGDKSLHYVV
jgi:hypothetical protein